MQLSLQTAEVHKKLGYRGGYGAQNLLKVFQIVGQSRSFLIAAFNEAAASS
jgi:hypothetical protein